MAPFFFCNKKHPVHSTSTWGFLGSFPMAAMARFTEPAGGTLEEGERPEAHEPGEESPGLAESQCRGERRRLGSLFGLFRLRGGREGGGGGVEKVGATMVTIWHLF